MIRLAREAQDQVAALTEYYAERQRDAAIDLLALILERASDRFTGKLGLSYPSPRPYPALPYRVALDQRGAVLGSVYQG